MGASLSTHSLFAFVRMFIIHSISKIILRGTASNIDFVYRLDLISDSQCFFTTFLVTAFASEIRGTGRLENFGTSPQYINTICFDW